MAQTYAGEARVDPKTGVMIEPGNVMEVHILPDESELLDWDKPLSEQSAGVREILSKSPYGPFVEDERGSDIYRTIAARAGVGSIYGPSAGRNPMLASKTLHEAGVPGIKYLDQDSRGGRFQVRSALLVPRVSGIEELPQTFNYVIFDPSNLRIVGRNGQRLTPVEGDPFAGEPPR